MPITYKVVKTGIHGRADFRRKASRRIIGPAVDRNAKRLQRQTKQNFPVGVTGEGRDSIKVEGKIKDGNPIRFVGAVFSDAKQVTFVERGTRPHVAPIRPLRAWAKLKNIPVYALRAGIAKRGTRAQRPFARAVDALEQTIQRSIVRAWRKLERELSD